ncbi:MULTISPECIES: nuclear transport factor 2 family protein [Bacillus]|uniref:nuclear transport factor 2 family protein n=1 Tax=Bacillus TaxID=1386 RepID=UPI00031CF017|nr:MULTISPECIES: nuclear transport factor 2 family protein [Bacillus]
MTTQKGKMIENFVESFTSGNMNVLKEYLTDDIQWNLVGQTTIQGVDAFVKYLQDQHKPHIKETNITNTITHGITAAIDGTILVSDSSGNGHSISFCHIIRLNKFKDGKIKQLKTYIIHEKTE